MQREPKGGSVRILAIDPGTEFSAYVEWETGDPIGGPPGIYLAGRASNHEMLSLLADSVHCDVLAVEMIASYGMAVGAEVFETCLWTGRFIQCAVEWGDFAKVYRREVKIHLCNSAKAKDGNIRQAIIDRFGGKEKAIGKKAKPGPLYGIAGDVWAALAVAVTYAETRVVTSV